MLPGLALSPSAQVTLLLYFHLGLELQLCTIACPPPLESIERLGGKFNFLLLSKTIRNIHIC